MTAAVAGAETSHGNGSLHACSLHGIDEDARGFREERSKMTRGEKSTPSGLDDHVDVFECVPDGVTIERVARHLI
jgi:hypothetical protein